MSHNSLYHKSFPTFIYSFFSFHNLVLKHKELPLLMESFSSTKPINATNLPDLLLDHIFSTQNYEGISEFLPYYLRNSLTRSYFTYLDILGIEAEVFEASTTGLKNHLSPDFLKKVENTLDKRIANQFAEEVHKDTLKGSSKLIKKENAVSLGNTIAYLGYGGISTSAVSTIKPALITYGLNQRISTNFLTRQLAKVKPENFDKGQAILGFPKNKNSLNQEILTKILGRTKVEIAQEFGKLKGENGGCPTIHNPNSQAYNTIDIGDLSNTGMIEMLSYYIDDFIKNELITLFNNFPEAEQKAFFTQWERDLIGKRYIDRDWALFAERFGDLDNYYRDLNNTAKEISEINKYFSSSSIDSREELRNESALR